MKTRASYPPEKPDDFYYIEKAATLFMSLCFDWSTFFCTLYTSPSKAMIMDSMYSLFKLSLNSGSNVPT